MIRVMDTLARKALAMAHALELRAQFFGDMRATSSATDVRP